MHKIPVPEPVEGSKRGEFHHNLCPEGIKLNRIRFMMIVPFPGRGYTLNQMMVKNPAAAFTVRVRKVK
jgi:hypothetical protein